MTTSEWLEALWIIGSPFLGLALLWAITRWIQRIERRRELKEENEYTNAKDIES